MAAQERFVRLGRASEHGLKLIIARATAGDAIWFQATVDRIADILARQGDTDPVEVRRSKAIGILAQPAEALQLLRQHQHHDWDGPGEPADPEQEPTELRMRSASRRPSRILSQPSLVGLRTRLRSPRPLTSRCKSPGRRLIRIALGRVPWCMSISAKKPSPSAAVWPGSKTSGRCCWAGCAACSGTAAGSA